jgi:putative endonuclease
MAGEDLAVAYLRTKGYRVLRRNYFFGQGEIDIIANDKGTLVFVEVKSRRSADFVEPEDAVSQRKATLVRRTAEGYLLQHKLDDTDCRFDIIAIDYLTNIPDIRHIEDAF